MNPDRDAILREQVRLSYAQTTTAVVGGMLSSSLFAYMLSPAADPRVLSRWLAAMFVLLVVRAPIGYSFHRRRNDEHIRQWSWLIRVMAFLTAALWGSAWFIILPGLSQAYVAGAAVYTLGIATASVVSYTVNWTVVLIYFLTVMLPCTIQLFRFDGALPHALGFGLVLSIPVFLRAGRVMNRGMVDAIRVRLLLEQEVEERKKAEAKLQELSLTDRLTGLPNRRHLDEMLDVEVRRARRTSRPVSLILLDIDYFKAFNDTYGHIEGDSCLQKVSRAIVGTLRRSADVAARYGGEEIVVILPDANEAQASTMAEKIRAAVEALAIPNAGSRVDSVGVVTISAGVSTVVPNESDDQAALLGRADKALYEAKNRGRNRVVLFNA